MSNADGNFNERIESQANRKKDFIKKAFAFNINQENEAIRDRISEKVFPNFRRLIEEKAFDYFSFLSIVCFENVIKDGKGDPKIIKFKNLDLKKFPLLKTTNLLLMKKYAWRI